MDTKQIYEKLMLDYYFNKMKHLRDGWKGSPGDRLPGVASLIDIDGDEYRQYKYIMDRCNNIVFEMLAHVVRDLLSAYEIPVKFYDVRTSGATAYYVGEEKHWIDYIDHHEEKQVLAFSRLDRSQDVLYVFKKFGIQDRLPKKTINELLRKTELDRYCYISYVESEAFAEVINHNTDENDPTRGTGIYSLKQFIEGFFGVEEYIQFKTYADLLSKKVKDYFGFALVRTLKPNAIHNFKKYLRDDLRKLNLVDIGVFDSIDAAQREIIQRHFFDDHNYEILLGSSTFAQSYMTSEWLYASLANAGNIDLTAIAMGYFKAIEQLLFAFLKNHTTEQDGHIREVYVGNKSYANSRGYALLDDNLLNDSEKVKDINLGSLTGFFGYHDYRRNQYYKRNQDLLVDGIAESTYELIIDTLGGIVGLRNGYFHKDNLIDWNKVDEARQKARLVFFIILGAYSISDTDKTRMGLIQVEMHDDYYKLCEYVNQKAYESQMFEIPIVYVNDISDPYAFGYFHHDDYIEYDNYGSLYIQGCILESSVKMAGLLRRIENIFQKRYGKVNL